MSRSITSKLPPLVYHILSPHPGPINCTTFPATKFIVDDPAHPLYIKTQRRLALFDRTAFHFRVHCPFDISKKAVIRNTVRKTFEKAFIKELERAGWAPDGNVLEGKDRRQDRLSGACLVNIVKDSKRVLQASKQDVRSEMARLVDDITARRVKQQTKSPYERAGSRLRSDRESSGEGVFIRDRKRAENSTKLTRDGHCLL